MLGKTESKESASSFSLGKDHGKAFQRGGARWHHLLPGACGWHLGRDSSLIASCRDHNSGRYWILHSLVHLPQLKSKRREKQWMVEVLSWFQALFQFVGTFTEVLLEPCKWDWFSLLTLLPYSHPRNRFCFSQAQQCHSFQIPWICSLCWTRCLCWAGGSGSYKSWAYQPVTVKLFRKMAALDKLGLWLNEDLGGFKQKKCN